MICDEDKETISPSETENAIEISESCGGNLKKKLLTCLFAILVLTKILAKDSC